MGAGLSRAATVLLTPKQHVQRNEDSEPTSARQEYQRSLEAQAALMTLHCSMAIPGGLSHRYPMDTVLMMENSDACPAAQVFSHSRRHPNLQAPPSAYRSNHGALYQPSEQTCSCPIPTSGNKFLRLRYLLTPALLSHQALPKVLLYCICTYDQNRTVVSTGMPLDGLLYPLNDWIRKTKSANSAL